MIFSELDEWAYDIEQKFNNGDAITPKERRQYVLLINLRDRHYKLYKSRVDELNKFGLGLIGMNPVSKYCLERYPKPSFPSRN